MILYFSGTGNSRFAAKLIAEALADESVSINALLKNEGVAEFQSEKPFVFVAPVYAWRLPRIVSDFIRRSRFEGSAEAYFVLTCGSGAGRAGDYARALCMEKRLDFRGLASVVMPENFITLFRAPEPREAEELIRNAVPRIRQLAAEIAERKPFEPDKKAFAGGLLSGPVNKLFYPLFVKAKGFRTTGACTGCGRCAALCPLNNVSLSGGRPVWGDRCTQCMACIGGCPTRAVEYGRKTAGKTRYYLAPKEFKRFI